MGSVGLGEATGGDGAAVEHDAGDVEAGHGHDGAGHVLVAAGDADDAVEEVAAGDELDGVGDDFAGDERGFHAFGAHGDAVGDGDGVELHGGSAGFADAFLDGFGDVAEVEVAWADLGPGVGYSDDRFVEVFFGEAYAAEVGAGGGAGGAFGQGDAVFFRVHLELSVGQGMGVGLVSVIFVPRAKLRKPRGQRWSDSRVKNSRVKRWRTSSVANW